jgi:hypothetical protein
MRLGNLRISLYRSVLSDVPVELKTYPYTQKELVTLYWRRLLNWFTWFNPFEGFVYNSSEETIIVRDSVLKIYKLDIFPKRNLIVWTSFGGKGTSSLGQNIPNFPEIQRVKVGWTSTTGETHWSEARLNSVRKNLYFLDIKGLDYKQPINLEVGFVSPLGERFTGKATMIIRTSESFRESTGEIFHEFKTSEASLEVRPAP